MTTAARAKVRYEGGQQAYAMSALVDSGDRITFTSSASRFSQRSGLEPVIRPNGLRSGGEIIPAVSGSDDVVDTAALTCNLNGVVTTVAADTDVSITRPATAVSKVNSITVNSSGAIAVVAGVDGSTTAFSETRGANGGPPLIPVDSIEIGQVRVTSDTSAAITSAQVFQVLGLHTEYFNYPNWTVDYQNAEVDFDSALPAIHTGPVAKAVHASYADPIAVDVPIASDFAPPENSYSVSSTQVYGRTIGASSASLGQGSFTAFLENGVYDPLLQLEGENLWFEFYPNRDDTDNYIVCQGILGFTRTFPADDSIQAACTISAESAAANVIG